jgi:hypothetical protein
VTGANDNTHNGGTKSLTTYSAAETVKLKATSARDSCVCCAALSNFIHSPMRWSGVNNKDARAQGDAAPPRRSHHHAHVL